MSPLAIAATQVLIVAVLVAALVLVFSCVVVGLSWRSVDIDALLSVTTVLSILANSNQQIIR
jgi:hypothetical protein